jgi:2-dehydro-3-deoxyphosphogluconate aldolase/(4S)-4-hydroxy-2-oxoglutarate aldolase
MLMVAALVKAGVTVIEITYTTPDAESIVTALAEKYGDSIILGMGTLTRPEQALTAKAARAQFLVSPVCQPDLVSAMIFSGLVTMVGALTPTEVWQAFQTGCDVVKIFPGSLGGPTYLKALKGPFPQIPMMSTGGVDLDNIASWFAAGVIAVGAGSQLCPPQLAHEGNFEAITRIASQFVAAVETARQ